MCGSVARRIELTVHYFARLEVDNHHVGGFHLVIADTAGLDDDEAFLTVNTRNVAPGKDDQSLLHKVQIGLEYFLFEFF